MHPYVVNFEEIDRTAFHCVLHVAFQRHHNNRRFEAYGFELHLQL